MWQTVSPPKVAFISWLCVRNRLYTLDRIKTFHPDVNTSYVLCTCALETRDHLFFECDFFAHILHCVRQRVGIDTHRRKFADWVQLFAAARHKNNLIFKIRAATFSMVIYWV